MRQINLLLTSLTLWLLGMAYNSHGAENSFSFEISNQSLLRAIRGGTQLVTRMPDRPEILGCTQLIVASTNVTFVASDGRRIALFKFPCKNPDNIVQERIIRPDALDKLANLLPLDGNATFDLTGKGLKLRTSELNFSLSLHEPPFFEWQKVTSIAYSDTVKVPHALLIKAIRKCCLKADGKPAESFKILLQRNELRINNEEGAAVAVVPIEFQRGTRQFRLNPWYVLDFLRISEGDNFSLLLPADEFEPLLFVEGGNRFFHYYLMPMKG